MDLRKKGRTPEEQELNIRPVFGELYMTQSSGKLMIKWKNLRFTSEDKSDLEVFLPKTKQWKSFIQAEQEGDIFYDTEKGLYFLTPKKNQQSQSSQITQQSEPTSECPRISYF